MANKFLDLSGLTRLWAKAVEKFALKSHSHSAASTTAAGMMSAADKKKLESIDEGANKYTHPTTTGYRHIPSGGASGQILRWSEDGAAVWGADNNTTYGTGSATTAGIVKLYTGTGANTDGSMTQNAITNELNNKAD